MPANPVLRHRRRRLRSVEPRASPSPSRNERPSNRSPRCSWNASRASAGTAGMLLDDATMQVSFLKDLVTMRNPTSDFSFLSYLHERGRLVDFINHKIAVPAARRVPRLPRVGGGPASTHLVALRPRGDRGRAVPEDGASMPRRASRRDGSTIRPRPQPRRSASGLRPAACPTGVRAVRAGLAHPAICSTGSTGSTARPAPVRRRRRRAERRRGRPSSCTTGSRRRGVRGVLPLRLQPGRRHRRSPTGSSTPAPSTTTSTPRRSTSRR